MTERHPHIVPWSPRNIFLLLFLQLRTRVCLSENERRTFVAGVSLTERRTFVAGGTLPPLSPLVGEPPLPPLSPLVGEPPLDSLSPSRAEAPSRLRRAIRVSSVKDISSLFQNFADHQTSAQRPFMSACADGDVRINRDSEILQDEVETEPEMFHKYFWLPICGKGFWENDAGPSA